MDIGNYTYHPGMRGICEECDNETWGKLSAFTQYTWKIQDSMRGIFFRPVFINYGNMWGSIKVIGFKTQLIVYPFMISRYPLH